VVGGWTAHSRRFVAAPFAVCALWVVFAAGCTANEEDLLRRAQALGEERQWLEARPLLQDYLRRHPHDAAAHFLLGRSWLHLPDEATNETLARGEMLTAYAIYERTGDLGILADQSDAEFRSFFHLLMATSYLRLARRAITSGAIDERLIRQLEAALQHVRRGLEHEPDSAFLQEMMETIQPMLHELREDHRTPERWRGPAADELWI